MLLLDESFEFFLLLLFSLFLVVVVDVTDVVLDMLVCWAQDGQPPDVGGTEVDARSWTSSC